MLAEFCRFLVNSIWACGFVYPHRPGRDHAGHGVKNGTLGTLAPLG